MDNSKYVEAKASRNKKRYFLTTIDGGWVEIVRMDHGQSLARLDDILMIELHDDGSQSGKASNVKGRHFDFANCIVDHNLALDGKQCDFYDSADVDALDEDIGDEIQLFINQHHGRVGSVDDDGPESDPN